MHKIYHGYCRSVWEVSQHPDIPGIQFKWKVNRDNNPLTLLIQKLYGKIVLASLCTFKHFLDHFTLNKTGFHDVSAILNSHLQWTPSLPPILNELRIANFPEILMSSLIGMFGQFLHL